jgi:SAM-dependent methyltransferase
MSSPDRFRISTTLLHDSPAAWTNLGLWGKPHQDYVDSAIALANRHWQLATPATGARLLDAGCGYGASLSYWRLLDPTLKLTALEYQPTCLQQLAKDGWTTIEGRFDTLPLPAGLPAASQDTVICLDSAYHARSLLNFARFVSQVLAPGGVLVFSTLLVSQKAKASTRLLLRAAGVPTDSQISAKVLKQSLEGAGLKLVEVVDLDLEGDGVLKGFAAYTQRRKGELTLRQRMSAEWLKIAMTGRLCAKLSAEAEVSYVLVRAERCST